VPKQVDILDIEPRINPRLGKTYGTNAAASWGYQVSSLRAHTHASKRL
jgi:hypothetical protein